MFFLIDDDARVTKQTTFSIIRKLPVCVWEKIGRRINNGLVLARGKKETFEGIVGEDDDGDPLDSYTWDKVN